MADVLRVLLIEDDLVDRKTIERWVQSENLPYECLAVTTVAQAKTALAAQKFDIVLADYTMADGTALDVLNIVHDLPVIVVAGTGNEETAVRAMKQGAYDYLVKDYDRNYLKMLPLVIENTLKRKCAEDTALQQTKELAASEERQHIARELHDSLSQTLFSISTLAGTASRLVHQDNDQLKHVVDELNQLTHQAMNEMRILLTELRPRTFGESALDELLTPLVHSQRGRTRVELELMIEGHCRKFAPEVHLAVYRIAQESLNNIIRHSAAQHATLHLQCDETGGRLLVHDDGVGFDMDSILPDSYGLAIMRERAAAIGAILQIETLHGKGTSVTLKWQEAV